MVMIIRWHRLSIQIKEKDRQIERTMREARKKIELLNQAGLPDAEQVIGRMAVVRPSLISLRLLSLFIIIIIIITHHHHHHSSSSLPSSIVTHRHHHHHHHHHHSSSSSLIIIITIINRHSSPSSSSLIIIITTHHHHYHHQSSLIINIINRHSSPSSSSSSPSSSSSLFAQDLQMRGMLVSISIENDNSKSTEKDVITIQVRLTWANRDVDRDERRMHFNPLLFFFCSYLL